jgi:hypothetical protein
MVREVRSLSRWCGGRSFFHWTKIHPLEVLETVAIHKLRATIAGVAGSSVSLAALHRHSPG